MFCLKLWQTDGRTDEQNCCCISELGQRLAITICELHFTRVPVVVSSDVDGQCW